MCYACECRCMDIGSWNVQRRGATTLVKEKKGGGRRKVLCVDIEWNYINCYIFIRFWNVRSTFYMRLMFCTPALRELPRRMNILGLQIILIYLHTRGVCRVFWANAKCSGVSKVINDKIRPQLVLINN